MTGTGAAIARTQRARAAGRLRLGLFVAGLSSVGIWAITTSAVWTESVTLPAAGPDGGALVSSSFGVEQRGVDSRGTAGDWTGASTDDPSSALPFGDGASKLEPGRPAYGGLEIRTIDGSLPGLVSIGRPTIADHGGDSSASLAGHLRARIVEVVTVSAEVRCGPDAFAGRTPVFDGPLLAPRESPSRSLFVSGDGASTALVCFEIALAPGASTSPAIVDVSWPVEAVSVE